MTEESSRLLSGMLQILFIGIVFLFLLMVVYIAHLKFLILIVCFMEDYVYHTLAAKPSGELCLKYIFSFGAFAKSPLLYR